MQDLSGKNLRKFRCRQQLFQPLFCFFVLTFHLLQIFASPEARIGLNVFSINGQLVKAYQTKLTAQVYDLRKQARQACKMPQPETINGPEVRYSPCCQIDKIGTMDYLVPDSPATHDPAIVGIKQHLQHHLGVAGGIPFFSVVCIYPFQVKLFHCAIDHGSGFSASGKILLETLTKKSCF